MDLIQMIVIISVIVLLPIIPAYLLYKVLPTKTIVSGPFEGFNIYLSGAFAAYFLVFLVVLNYFLNSLSRLEIYEPWKIEGAVQLSDHGPKVESTQFLVKPPDQEVYTDGTFRIKNMALRKKKDRDENPSLIIMKEGYNPQSLVLNESPVSLKGFKDYGIKYQTDKKVIKIEIPIVLERASRRYEYKIETDNMARPIGEKEKE